MSEPPESENELLEVLNGRGGVLGLRPRGECHGDPTLAHRAVHVLVVNPAGDVFLQKRSLRKKVQPGRWDSSAGGHLLPGESYEEAARRELEEELGVVPPASPPPAAGGLEHLHDYLWRSELETELVRTFLLRHEGPFRLSRDEIEHGRFFGPDELRRLIGTGTLTPNLEEELRRARITG